MDKETLSNYGWIVICVLVLAVMIALATPFGDYISTAVKSTTQGLFDVNKNALNSTGLINVGDQSFGDKDSEAEKAIFYYDYGDYVYTKNVISGNGFGASTLEEGKQFFTNYYVPMLTGMSLEDLLEQGIIEEDDLSQLYQQFGLTEETFEPAVLGDKWRVNVKSTTQKTYGSILESIKGEPVTDMSNTFQECTSLITAPAIPSGVTDMSYAFNGCFSLATAPVIPSSVTNMDNTFCGCSSLVAAPDMSNASSVTNMSSTFNGCSSLVTAPVIPDGVTNMFSTFRDCTSLTTAPSIPSGVTSMFSTFENCTSLTTAPIIPEGVTDMTLTFMSCESLIIAPTIPSSVTNMNRTFCGCQSLNNTPTIPNNVTNMYSTFYNCTLLQGQTITIPASVTDPSGTSGTWGNGPSWIKQ